MDLEELNTGTFVVKSLFSEFSKHVEKKLEACIKNKLTAKDILKSLQPAEDPKFDQLLNVLRCVAENCLPSLFGAIMNWFNYQLGKSSEDLLSEDSKNSPKNCIQNEPEKRQIFIKIVFCLTLIKILEQLRVFPLAENKIDSIITICFLHFRSATSSHDDVVVVADLFAEIIGVLSRTKFESVKMRFTKELTQARVDDDRALLSLVVGMKFIRVKMYPIEEFEASFRFLRELADFFLEVKDREAKHAIAALFVEILVPVAAAVKTEVNIPVLRDFVDALYPTTLELSKRKKNQSAMYPLITCLLCISQKQFFLNNWHIFLDNCLSNLKHRDSTMSRVALESIYRLIWTYTIRVKCEGNLATQMKLQSVIKTIFPVGSRNVLPKDTPLSIFVKMIHFIAQEKLDFAMRDVIFDLISVSNSNSKAPKTFTLHPERINIGLRAFLVITDSLQQKEGNPPMPSTISVFPSGNTLRVKKIFLNKTLTDDEARQLRVLQYYKPIQKTLDAVLQALDNQVGQRLIMTNAHLNHRALDIVSLENKPKIELFRTCIAAMPRLLPSGNFGLNEIFELLSRMTIHVDEELRCLSFNTLQLFLKDFPDQRENIIASFIFFILTKVTDGFPEYVESSIRHLIKFVSIWSNQPRVGQVDNFAPLIRRSESFALMLMCNTQISILKLSSELFLEVHKLALSLCNNDDVTSCSTVINNLLPQVINDVIIECKPGSEVYELPRDVMTSVAASRDLSKFIDWCSSLAQTNPSSFIHLWRSFIRSLLNLHYLPSRCRDVIDSAWYDVNVRQKQLWQLIDPNISSTKKTSMSSLSSIHDNICLWTNFQVFLCAACPNSLLMCKKRASLAIPAGTADWLVTYTKFCDSLVLSPTTFFQFLIPLLKSDFNIRESVATGLGSTGFQGLSDLMKELLPDIRDSCKLVKQENLRRKRKRDLIRVIISQILEELSRHKMLSECVEVQVVSSPPISISQIMLEYINDTCSYLEGLEKLDAPSTLPQTSFLSSYTTSTPNVAPNTSLKFHFSSLLTNFIKYLPPETQKIFFSNSLRKRIFLLLSKWFNKLKNDLSDADKSSNPLYLMSLKGECAILCCSSVFEESSIQQDGYIYPWLELLLDCEQPKVCEIGREAVTSLLYHNPHQPHLLQWLIGKCYTGVTRVSRACFHSIVSLYSHTDLKTYQLVSLINLAIYFMFVDETSQSALLLLFLLNSRYQAKSDDVIDFTNLSVVEISSKLSSVYSSFNIQFLSEVFKRLPDTHLSGQRNMLRYLLPWLQHIPLTLNASSAHYVITIFLFSNLTYITCKYWHLFSLLISGCWKSLCEKISSNLICVLHYITGLLASNIADDVIRVAKRILACLMTSYKPQVEQYLFSECQIASPALFFVNILPTSPYLKITEAKRDDVKPTSSSHTSPEHFPSDVISVSSSCSDVITDAGELGSRGNDEECKFSSKPHHKSLQHLPEEPPSSNGVKLKKINFMSSSILSLPSSLQHQASPKRGNSSSSPLFFSDQLDEIGEDFPLVMKSDEEDLFQPDLGDCFKMKKIEDTLLLYRCNISCVLLSMLATEHGRHINLKDNFHVIIISCLLGLDHFLPNIVHHCKMLLVHVIVLMTSQSHQVELMPTLVLSGLHGNHLFPASHQAIDDVTDDEQTEMTSQTNFRHFFHLLFDKARSNFWMQEPQKKTSISHLVSHLICLVHQLLPEVDLKAKLADKVINFASSPATNQQYANRAFQIYRALQVPMTSQHLCAIVRTLITHVMTSSAALVIAEILMTLRAGSDLLVTNLNVDDVISHRVSEKLMTSRVAMRRHNRCRSGSVILASGEGLANKLNAAFSSTARSRKSELISLNHRHEWRPEVMTSSSSKNYENEEQEMLAQILWICQIMLKTDQEQHFELSMQIIQIIFTRSPLAVLDDIIEKRKLKLWMIKMKSENLMMLILKGLHLKQSHETSFNLLSHIFLSLHLPIVTQPSNKGDAFALCVIASLPNLLLEFSHPGEVCKRCSSNISQVCFQDFTKYNKLQSLSHIMQLYESNSFNKPMVTWLNAVCKYIYESFPSALHSQIIFLKQLIEKGPSIFQLPCLQIINSLLSLSNLLDNSASRSFAFSILDSVLQHVQLKHWNAAMSVLKLSVARCSRFINPMTSSNDKQLPGRELMFEWTVGESISDVTTCNQLMTSSSSLLEIREELRSIHNNFVDGMETHHNHLLLHHSNNCEEVENVKDDPNDLSRDADSDPNDDIRCPGALRDFDFLDEFEVDADDTFSNMRWGKSPTSSSKSNSPLKKKLTTMTSSGHKKSTSDLIYDMTSVTIRDDESIVTSSSSTTSSSSVERLNDLGKTSQRDDDVIADESEDDDVTTDSGWHEKLMTSSSSASINLMNFNSSLTYIRSISPSPPDLSDAGNELMKKELFTKSSPNSSNFDSNRNKLQITKRWSCSVERAQSRSFTPPPSGEEWVKDEDIYQWMKSLDEELDGKIMSQLITNFQSLFNEICQRFCHFGYRACDVIAHKLHWLTSHFRPMLDNLPSQLRCPLFLFTKNLCEEIATKIKKELFQLRDNLMIYISQKKSAEKLLRSLRHQMMTSATLKTSANNGVQVKSLCQHLYQIHHHLLLIFDNFNHLTSDVINNPIQKDDVTVKILTSHHNLSKVETMTSSTNIEQVVREKWKSMTSEECELALNQLIISREWEEAVKILRFLRSLRKSSSSFGASCDLASTSLTAIFFQHLLVNESGLYYAVIGDNDVVLTSKLMQVNREIQQSLNLLDAKSLST